MSLASLRQPQSSWWPTIFAVLIFAGGMVSDRWVLPLISSLPAIGGWVAPATGPRQTLVVRESEKDTPAMSNLFGQLQSSDAEFRAYLTEKKHTLDLYDDDAKDSAGQPLKILAPFQPFKETGEVLVLSGGKLVSREPLPTSTAGVLDIIKKAGG